MDNICYRDVDYDETQPDEHGVHFKLVEDLLGAWSIQPIYTHLMYCGPPSPQYFWEYAARAMRCHSLSTWYDRIPPDNRGHVLDAVDEMYQMWLEAYMTDPNEELTGKKVSDDKASK
jgi:hypothetical protein